MTSQLGKLLPEHGDCFVCGSHPSSIGVRWYAQEDNSIVGHVTLTSAQQGPPHHAHGGASAAMLDEAMGSASWYSGSRVMTVTMTTRYKAAVPLNVPLIVTGWVERKEGRKLFTRSHITLPDGKIAVEADGIFVEAGKHFDNNKAYAKRENMADNQ